MDQDLFNWLDLVFIIMIGTAAVRGFQRGFFVEIGSLIALWLGVYAAIHFSGYIAAWLDLGVEREIFSFLVTFLLVLVLVHLVARALTAVIEIALLGWANKLAGVLIAMLRSAFVLSIVLNILIAYTDSRIPPQHLREGSALHHPIRSFAPLVLPQLAETKWVRDMIEMLKQEVAWDSDPENAP